MIDLLVEDEIALQLKSLSRRRAKTSNERTYRPLWLGVALIALLGIP